METRSAAKKRKLLILYNQKDQVDDDDESEKSNRSRSIDRISDLPDAVLHHILFLLPVKTVAQTSVLSKRWRSIWSSFPDLDFTTLTRAPTKPHSSSSKSLSQNSKETDFIRQVLTLRDKHSDIRILRFGSWLSFSRLNGLIRLAIRRNVQELDVEVATEDYFNFPRCVIASESLRIFKLKSHYPGFRLPPSSVMTSGFKSLHLLSLSRIVLYNQPSLCDMFGASAFPMLKKLSLDACFGLKYLRIGCKALEDLTLENCFQLQGLDVLGGKLERLRIVRCFDAYADKSWVKIDGPRLRIILWENNAITDSSSLDNLSSLQEASIGFFLLQEDISVAKLQSVSNLFMGLYHAHCLTLDTQCIEILSNSNYFAVYLHPFNNLKSLELHTGFNKNNVPGLACIFRSSPMLHTLTLNIINDYKIERRQWNKDLWEMSNSEEEKFWESQTQALKSFLQNLTVVKIQGFLECENEVSLAKFLLKHGKALQEMILCTGHCKARYSLQRQKIRSQMMGFSWASSNAKIAFH
ncbi:PREDICTED: putative F-box/FBD/LRR-repeat protein At4g03220 [Prunus mume]|uniref:F-box/FBD/LRR-repeat protein At4g03220 n=1 Tax=Prunus mume TaxID=102107 RepID=A0ABM0NUU5_PRUMU|nr:PREDICTED: putative F-box/FBD/LRR-repeat protein At4g03220 [Prunus mume]